MVIFHCYVSLAEGIDTDDTDDDRDHHDTNYINLHNDIV